MTNRTSRILMLVGVMLFTASIAQAKEKETYGFLRRHPPGVGAQATYTAPNTSVLRVTAAASSPSSVATGTHADGPPAPVAISAHNCIPRSQPVGVSLSFDIVESSVGDCISFVSPEPVPDRPARGPRRAPRPSPESLAQRAFDRVISLAPDPELGIAPARVGLTGLPSFFWVDGELAPVTATAGVRGLTVTAEARPVRYQWDFDDGTTRSTQHGGRPWTRGRDGNVGHVYEAKGRYEPGVTVLWAARWRVNGGPWADLGYFSTAGSAEYPVREMIAVLVRRR